MPPLATCLTAHAEALHLPSQTKHYSSPTSAVYCHLLWSPSKDYYGCCRKASEGYSDLRMVQNLSHSLVTSRFNVLCGYFSRKSCSQVKETCIILEPPRSCRCVYGRRVAPLSGSYKMSRHGGFRVQAGWLFKGNDKGSDLDARCEHSERANEDILMFFFELDLATRVQYALNLEQYEAAQQLRNKLTEVESEVIKLRESKRGSSSKSEAQDMAISILRLRADMQNAIEGENYVRAAELRDEISKLEAKSLAASVKAQAYESAKYVFRLGQKVKHKVFGYQAVICGMDPVCCESKSWIEGANIDSLTRGPDQPFYQVLVDMQEDPNLLVAYVAEENLLEPEQRERDRFDHPYASFLFYGMDGAGDFIPIKQLREKYNQPRHELPYDPADEDNGKDDA